MPSGKKLPADAEAQVRDFSLTPRKLLFVSNLFPDTESPYRGLDNATVLHELRRLNEWDVRVLCPRPTLSPARLGRRNGGWECREEDVVLRPEFLPVPYVPRVGSRVNHLLMAAALRPRMRDLADDFDVVLASWLYPDGCAVARVLGQLERPYVLITQGSDTHSYMNYKVRRKLILRAIEGSSGVIARSKELALSLEKAGADAELLHAVYNGVDQTVFHPQSQAEARAQLGLPAGARIALFVGNFLEVKNPRFLVTAFADFVKGELEHHDLLIMAGRGPLVGEIQKLIVSLGMADKIILTGPLDSRQIALRMAASDYLCLSSHSEGLPNVILEAFACGLPVLSTDVGGIHEIVNNPAFGMLVPPGNVTLFSGALRQMASGRWQRDVISAFGGGFSWEKSAAAYSGLLTSALQSNHLSLV